MNYFPFHCGDWASHTMTLTTYEKGAYITMLCAIMATEKPLEKDEALQMCAAFKAQERKSVEKVIAGFFFTTPDGRLHNKRAQHEIDEAKKRSETASANAKKRWGGDADGNADAYALAMPPHDSGICLGNASQRPKAKGQKNALTPPPPIPAITRTDGRGENMAAAAGSDPIQPAAQTPQEIAEALDDAGISSAKKRAQIASTQGVTAALIRKFAEDGRNRGKGPGAIAENILAEAPKAARTDERTAKAKATLAETQAKQRAKAEADAEAARRWEAESIAAVAKLRPVELKALWKVVSDGEDPQWMGMKRAKFDAKNARHRFAVLELKRQAEAMEGGAA